MDVDWLEPHPAPKKPDFIVPEGAVDAHCHVFGPAAQFSFAEGRKYTPGDASKQRLFDLRDHLGFGRNVIVQASCHGRDNAALLDALQAAGDLARGVAVVGPEITDAELAMMDRAGVRAVRFNFVRRLVTPRPPSEYLEIARRVVALGWHIVVYFEAADMEDLTPFLKQLPGLVVIDHMGRPEVKNGIEHADFMAFMRLMDGEKFWTKTSCPERLSAVGPPYRDVIPFARKLIDSFGGRVLWGSDWPHPNMKSHMPDDGQLVDLIPEIATSSAKQRALLVDNPLRLYWP